MKLVVHIFVRIPQARTYADYVIADEQRATTNIILDNLFYIALPEENGKNREEEDMFAKNTHLCRHILHSSVPVHVARSGVVVVTIHWAFIHHVLMLRSLT